MVKIVIDTLGADMGMEPVVAGIAEALNRGVEFFPVLVGPADGVRQVMSDCGIEEARYEIMDACSFIRNEDPPTCIFGGCDDSSMAIAYGRLKSDPECSAMLSPGSTGALLVGSICRLGLLPGMKSPALASMLPCIGDGLLCLVDCGANIKCSSDDLVRFAKMGDVFSRSYCGIDRPRIGLMSVGREKQKGTPLVREAYEKLSQLEINFVGNVEGSDMATGYADVIVTDGFSGNLLLKCAGGIGQAAVALVDRLSEGSNDELVARIRQALYETFDFNDRGAATFLGPKKTVVKMHGCANADATVASIEQILRLEKAQFSQKMAEAMSK